MHLEWTLEQEAARVSFDIKNKPNYTFNPRCVPVTCDPPPSVPMAVLSSASSMYSVGDEASYDCVPGHTLVTSGPMECGDTGKWSAQPPQCVPQLCPGPGAVLGGNLVIGSWTLEPLPERTVEILRENINKKSLQMSVTRGRNVLYPVGSELMLTCNPGYKLAGSGSVLCVTEDTWTSQLGACEEVVCPALGNLDNGKLMIEGFKFRQSVYYECDLGYSLGGSYSRTCLDTGLWSGQEPTCVPVMCPEPGDIQHGELASVTSVEYGAIITYTCSPGHVLLGGSERVCGPLGTWSGQQPVCANTSDTCLMSKLANSRSETLYGGLEVNSQALYECHRQTEIKDGGCQPVRTIPRGSVIGDSWMRGASLQFECEQGSRLEGASVITCGHDNMWSSPVPLCVPVLCPQPGDVDHGRVWGSARRLGDSVSYTCDPRYTLLGTRVRVCGRDGDWGGVAPRCALITCPLLPSLRHGHTDTGLRIPGEKTRFRCDLGWSLTGANNITCTTQGSWEGAMPSCEPAACYLNTDTNAQLLSDLKPSYPVGSELLWDCDNDLSMSGSSKIRCLPTGDWDSQPPECVRPECSKVIPVENGIVFGMKQSSGKDTEINFSCDNGYYKIQHSGPVQCAVGGTWVGPVPVCARHECPPLVPPSHGDLVMRPGRDGAYFADFSCHQQYEARGERRINCQASNLWDSHPPVCVLSYCPPVPQMPGIVYRSQKTRLGDSAMFECEPGFELVGDKFVKCLASGRWENPFPVCKPKVCRLDRNLRHGVMTIVPSEFKKRIWSLGSDFLALDNAVLTVGDKLNTSCDAGYEVLGRSLVTCLPSTSLESELPRCRQSYCSQLPHIENGFILDKARYRGASVTYSCHTGYTLVGSRERRCRRNKSWSGSVPVCEIVECDAPHDVAHGEVEYTRGALEYGAEIRYSCHLGYEIVGSESRVCGGRGEWEGPEPECVQVRCPVPRIPLHGDQEIQSLVVGGSVHYRCNHGYRLTGSPMLTCLGNKTWSHVLPQCERVQCQQPATISHGVVLVSNLEFQSSVQYRCGDGFNLVGHHSLTCLHTGQWSAPPPSCVANLCPDLSVSQGHVSQEGRVPGDVARVSCELGYVLRGPGRLVCQMSLDWTPGPPPVCQPVNCGDPPGVEHAISHADGFSFMDTANYTCLLGYEKRVLSYYYGDIQERLYLFQGDEKLTCGGDGQWTGPLPSCVPKPCDFIESPENAVIKFFSTSGYDQGYGSEAHVECGPGHVSLHPSVLTCGAEGQWSGEIHPCVKIPCGAPPLPENGNAVVSIKSDEYIAEYSCHTGYLVEGPNSITCRSNSQWQFGM